MKRTRFFKSRKPSEKGLYLLSFFTGRYTGIFRFCCTMMVLSAIYFLLAPALVKETESSRRQTCANRLRQIAMALGEYREVFGVWPPAYVTDSHGTPLHSWRVLILPYLQVSSSQRLYRDIRLNEPWDSEHNRQFHNRMPLVYRCPSLRTQTGNASDCSYFMIIDNHSSAIIGKSSTQDCSGVSNHIIVVERKEPVNWMTPDKEPRLDVACRGINIIADSLGSFHPGGMNAALADGSVRFISETIDPGILRGLLFHPCSDHSP